EDLALSSQLWNVLRAKGEGDGKVPSVETAKSYSFSAEDKQTVSKMKQKMILGNPQEVRKQLEELQANYGADEIMMVTITHSYRARLRSYELIAKEMINGQAD